MQEQTEDRWRVLDLVPVAWLVLVLLAYWFVLTAPAALPQDLTNPIPGLAEADRAAGPVLAATLLAGIIRYFGLRRSDRREISSQPSGRGRGGA